MMQHKFLFLSLSLTLSHTHTHTQTAATITDYKIAMQYNDEQILDEIINSMRVYLCYTE